MAARNNPLINWLSISFDTFNLLHRWTGRIVTLQMLAHVIAWAVHKVASTGWASAWKAISASAFMIYGFIVSFASRKELRAVLKHCRP